MSGWERDRELFNRYYMDRQREEEKKREEMERKLQREREESRIEAKLMAQRKREEYFENLKKSIEEMHNKDKDPLRYPFTKSPWNK